MTQTDLNRLLAAVISEAKQAAIPVSDRIVPAVKVNSRAKTRFGCCRRAGDDYTIEISAFLFHAGEKAVRQTLAHEILHTCPSCSNHGTLWRHWAAVMNRRYGYGIRRTDSPEHLGIPDERPVRWLVVCQRCGKEIPRMKRSPLVQHPERYRCSCGGTLTVKTP